MMIVRLSGHPLVQDSLRRRRELALVGVTSLPAWRGRSSWLARASTVLGRQVGCQVSPSAFCFSLFLFISVLCFEIVKILFHLEKSWKYSEAPLRLFPTA